ncbi:MAG TPA: CoA transferase subunit A [Firmicutes bacterium]|nr:CoA transferase subunit A [Bacillota bacterium]
MSRFGPDYSVHGDQEVAYRKVGHRRLFTDPDADSAREHFRSKSRKLVSKVTTAKKAVSRLLKDGDYLAVGGFGSNRIPTALLHEIVRQGKNNLGFSGHTATHDLQILAGGKCINRCDIAYVIGLEARGLSPISRKAFEEGEIEATEWTNAALAWRYKAASMGISFIPTRNMFGTDTLKYSAAVQLPCPYTGKNYIALPALYPDLAIIHVHRCDVYGNAQIDGITISDLELARAAKRLIISTERLVPESTIRQRPESTGIPFYLVDAVIEIPYGAYPANMAYEYFSDEEHLGRWLEVERDEEQFRSFLQKNIYDVDNHWEYITLNGGLERMQQLRAEELVYRQKMTEHNPGRG